MSSKQISYPPEYWQQIVELYLAGRKFSGPYPRTAINGYDTDWSSSRTELPLE